MKEKIIQQVKDLLNNKNIQELCKHLAKALAFVIAATVLIVLLTNLIYQEKTVIKRGFEVSVDEDAVAPKIRVMGSASSDDNEKSSTNVDIAALIKTANVDKGEKIFKKCAACHTIERGAKAKIGPNLFGIVGKSKASTVDFAYSDGLKNKGGKWTYKDLSQLLTKPSAYISGTKMSFAGLKKDQDRANVIAYLESVSR